MKHWIAAIAVAAVYLLLSVMTAQWQLTWLIWVGYAAWRFMEGRSPEQAK